MNNYYFNCDLGDTIYSLIILKHFGKGGFYYGPSHSSATTSHNTKENLLKSLLEYQNYVTSFGFTEEILWRNDYDANVAIKDVSLRIKSVHFNKTENDCLFINKSPNLFWQPSGIEMTYIPLIEIIAERFLINEQIYKQKWVNLPNIKSHNKDVIINRTFRYNKSIDLYIDIIKKNGENKCGFIGTKQEYEKFCFDSKTKIEHIITKDLFEAAIAIQSSKLFVGNQSSCMALAESIKHNTIQEVCTDNPNCLFTYRDNFHGMIPGWIFGFYESKYISISKKDFNECGIKIQMDTCYDGIEKISFNNKNYEIRRVEI